MKRQYPANIIKKQLTPADFKGYYEVAELALK